MVGVEVNMSIAVGWGVIMMMMMMIAVGWGLSYNFFTGLLWVSWFAAE